MAKREKKDFGINNTLDEIERKIFIIKIAYEKYFNGIEKFEPLKDLEDLKRLVRDLQLQPINNTQQRYRFTQLKARLSSLEMYWKRNLGMIEKGTHPKQMFRDKLHAGDQRDAEALAAQARQRRENDLLRQREEEGYQNVYQQLLEARRNAGQSTNISFDSIRETLRNQARTIKSKYKCDAVTFKVSVQDGKAKMTAVPIRNPDKDT